MVIQPIIFFFFFSFTHNNLSLIIGIISIIFSIYLFTLFFLQKIFIKPIDTISNIIEVYTLNKTEVEYEKLETSDTMNLNLELY